MKTEEFPADPALVRKLVEQCKKYRQQPRDRQACIYVNLSMVRLQLGWVLPKLMYAAGLAEATGYKVYVITWRDNALFKELVESFGFSHLVLEHLDRRHIGCAVKAALRTTGFQLFDGSGEGMKRLKYCDIPAGRFLYEDILRTSELSTIRSARSMLCTKKMTHILWMCGALECKLESEAPAYVIADDVAYHESMQLSLFYRYGAQVRNVSAKFVEKLAFASDGTVIRRHRMWRRQIHKLLKEGKGSAADAEELLDAQFEGRSGRNIDRGAFLNKQEMSRDELVEKLGLDPEKKNVLIMAHTFTDAVYSFGSLYFRDYYDWLDKTLAIAEGVPGVNWILKAHPTRGAYHESADSVEDMFARHKKDHIFMLPDEVSPKSVRELADVLLTVGGNAGAEYACYGVTPVIAGKPYYCGFGYTVEPADYEAYEAQLKDIAKLEPLNESQKRIAKRVYWLKKGMTGKGGRFEDEFARLLGGMYDEMMGEISVSYFESNRGTKSYNDSIIKAVTEYFASHDMRQCDYWRMGKEWSEEEQE